MFTLIAHAPLPRRKALLFTTAGAFLLTPELLIPVLLAVAVELRQRGQATDRKPGAVWPRARAQPQAILPAQLANARADVPAPALPLPSLAAAPPAHAAPVPRRAQPQRPSVLARLGGTGWVVLGIVCMLMGTRLGVLIAAMTAAWLFV